MDPIKKCCLSLTWFSLRGRISFIFWFLNLNTPLESITILLDLFFSGKMKKFKMNVFFLNVHLIMWTRDHNDFVIHVLQVLIVVLLLPLDMGLLLDLLGNTGAG